MAAMAAAAMAAALLVVGAPTPAGAAPVVIDFDDHTAPQRADEAQPLTDRYADLGVTFSGPTADAGGAVLDERSGLDVVGHSSPNVLAFDAEARLANGEAPAAPATITLRDPVRAVSLFTASSAGGTVTLEAYDDRGALVDSATGELRRTGVTLSVAGADIVTLVVSSTARWFVVDDLTLSSGAPPVADAGPGLEVALVDGVAEVELDGTASTDPDGDPLTFTWTGPVEGGTATGPMPTVTFTEPGDHEVALTVSDGDQTATDAVVTVVPPLFATEPAEGAVPLGSSTSRPTRPSAPIAPATSGPAEPAVAAGGAVPVAATPAYAG